MPRPPHHPLPAGSLVTRASLAFFALLIIACGGGGGDTGKRVMLRLENGGSTTTALEPSTDYVIQLVVTSPDGSLNLPVTFVYNSNHVEDIPDIEVVAPKGSTVTVDIPIRTKATGAAVNGEIEATIADKSGVTTQKLTYTITPAP